MEKEQRKQLRRANSACRGQEEEEGVPDISVNLNNRRRAAVVKKKKRNADDEDEFLEDKPKLPGLMKQQSVIVEFGSSEKSKIISLADRFNEAVKKNEEI